MRCVAPQCGNLQGRRPDASASLCESKAHAAGGRDAFGVPRLESGAGRCPKGEASDFSSTVTGSWLGVSPQNYGHRNLIHLNRWQFGSVPIAFGNTGTSLESLQTQLFLLRRRPYFNIDRDA
jgi:hypothetical protein